MFGDVAARDILRRWDSFDAPPPVLAWDESRCAAFGIPPEALAPIRPTRGDFGSVGAIRVTASVVDQQAALYGHGCRRPGECKITFGTGAFALAISGSTPAVPEAGLLSTVAWRIGDATTYAVEGGVYDVGAALEWAMRLRSALVRAPRR